MRIAFFTFEYVRPGHPDGGIANYFACVCRILKERGHEATVFLSGKQNARYPADNVDVIEVKEPALQVCYRIPRLRPYVDVLRQVLSARRLARAFHAEHGRKPFDVIHASGHRSVSNGVVSRAPVPVILYLPGFGPVFRSADGGRIGFSDHLADWLEIRQMLRADAVYAPSQYLREAVNRYLNVKAAVLRHPFHPRAEREDDTLYNKALSGSRYALYFGKLQPRKGAQQLADAAPALLRAFPDLKIVFAGKDCGPFWTGRHYRDSIPAAVGPQFKPNLVFLDNVNRASLLPLIRNATVVALPSLVDNYPNTFVEARAMGKIVVAFRGGSVDERIVDGETGFVADPSVPGSLAETVLRALRLSTGERTAMEARIARVASEDNQQDIERWLAFHETAIREFKGRDASLCSDKTGLARP